MRDLALRHPGRVAGVMGLTLGLVQGGVTGMLAKSITHGIFQGVAVAIALGLFSYWGLSGIAHAFPDGLTEDARAAVRSIVRAGGPAVDPGLAPAVIHHARAVLGAQFYWVAFVLLGGVGAVLGVVAITLGLKVGSRGSITAGAAWIALSTLVLFVVLPRVLIKRRNAMKAEYNARAALLD